MFKCLFSTFLLVYTLINFAGMALEDNKKVQSNPIQDVFKGALPGLIYSYVDFNFNSTSGANFNRFRGHSNIVGIGSNQLKLFKDVTGGLFIYHIDTTSMSHLSLNPNPATHYRADNKNNTILAHVMKPLKKGFSLDGGFGYGFNQTTLNGKIFTPGSSPFNGFANYHFNNWFANATLFYQHKVKSIVASAFVQGLYTRNDIKGYTQRFSAVNPPTAVVPLTTKISYVMENLNLRYKSNGPFSPFISAGLIQVVDYTQSRPTLTGIVIGSLPQLILDQNGYRVGGGLSYTHKKATAQVEYRHYQATRQFRSNQVTLNLTYLLD